MSLATNPADRRMAATVVAGHILATLVSVTLMPALPAMAAYFEAHDNNRLVVQSMVLLPLASMLIGAPVAGLVSDRLGYNVTLRILLVVFAVSGASGAVVPSVELLAVGRVALGISSGGIVAICSAITGNVFSGQTRERVLSISYAAASLGTVAAFPLSGLLVDTFGWRAPFFIYLISLVVLLFLRTQDVRRNGQPTNPISTALNRDVVCILAVAFVLGVGFQVLSAQGPFILEAANFKTAFEIGLLGAGAGGATMVGSAVYGRLRSLMGAGSICLLAFTLLSLSIFVMGNSRNPIVIISMIMMFGVGAGLSSPVLNSIVLSAAAPHIRGLISGFLISAISLGQFANPFIYSCFERIFPPDFELEAMAALVAFAGMIMFVLMQTDRKNLS